MADGDTADQPLAEEPQDRRMSRIEDVFVLDPQGHEIIAVAMPRSSWPPPIDRIIGATRRGKTEMLLFQQGLQADAAAEASGVETIERIAFDMRTLRRIDRADISEIVNLVAILCVVE